MVRAAPIKTSFNAGEWSPLMGGHINLERFPDSCISVINMIALKQGPVTRRPPSAFVKEVKLSSSHTSLIPFKFNVDQSYVIEAGDSYFRFYTDHGNIEDGGSPVEIVSPYGSFDLFDSSGRAKYQYAQSADVLYMAHGDFQTRALTRTSDIDWSIDTLEFVDGPYLPLNDTDTTLSLSGTTGSVTVTASATEGINGGDGFKVTDAGRLIRWNDGSDWTWLQITAFISTTSVTALIKGEDTAVTTATKDWRLALFSETTGFPTVVTFFQDRLFLAGAFGNPDTWALTISGGYSDTQLFFAPSDRDGTVTDDASIIGTLQSKEVNAIKSASSDLRGLVIMTESKEWLISPSSRNEALTPSNSAAKPISSVGGANVQAIEIESGSIYVQNAGRKIHDLIYSIDRDQIKPRDLTISAEHITAGSISELKYQQEPINTIWVRKNNGALVGMTYYPDEAVFAFHNHVIGGTDVLVKSIAVIKDPSGERDELWMIVERTIDGATVKYVEYLKRPFDSNEGDAKQDIAYVDSQLSYDGSVTDTVFGLDHLEGETVKVMVDGNSHPDLVVSSGSVTLDNDRTGQVIHIGLGYSWEIKPQRIEAGSKDGTAQGKTKRITRFTARLLETLGFYYGKSDTDFDEFDFNQGSVYDENLPLFSGDTPSLLWPDGYETDGIMYFGHDGVFPATILCLMPILTTYDR